jgi:hypothetical protein
MVAIPQSVEQSDELHQVLVAHTTATTDDQIRRNQGPSVYCFVDDAADRYGSDAGCLRRSDPKYGLYRSQPRCMAEIDDRSTALQRSAQRHAEDQPA